MKILVVLSRFPWPLEKGDKLRAFHFIRMLSAKHKVHLFALSDRKLNDADYEALAPYCASIEVLLLTRFRILMGLIRSMLKRLPFQVGYFYHPGAGKRLDEMVSRIDPDLIFCQLVRVAGYVTELPGKKILDYQDAFSLNMQRRGDASSGTAGWVFRREARLLRKYERELFDRFAIRLIISEPDRQAINHLGRDEIMVVPNGVDFNFFTPNDKAVKLYDIVFIGNMAYPPNVEGACWLANDILYLVRRTLPGATLLLAGSSPLRKVRRLEGRGITVSGWMPDIRQGYASARVFVAPMLSGSGLQNKLLEAMAMKIPCVTTSLANASLMALPEKEVLVADEAPAIAKAIVRLLQEEETSCRIADAGYQMVRRRFCWDTVINSLEEKMLNSE